MLGHPGVPMLVAACASIALAGLDQFVKFDSAVIVQASYSNLTASNANECAAKCLQDAQCVSFNVIGTLCELNRYGVTYSEIVSPGNSYYHRNQPRNDQPAHQAIPYVVTVPTGNVTLTPGSVLRRAFDANILYLLQHPADDLLYFFRQRSNVTSPPGQCWGWDANLRGSIAGEFLMGAGGTCRWPNTNSTLAERMKAVVDGIAATQEADGYIMAFPKNETIIRENPDYVVSWLTHGLLEAAIAGNSKALPLLRQHFNWFNNCTYLPQYLPPDDRPSAMHEYPTPSGHGIYLIYQGMIHNTRLALSPVGTEQDYQLVQTLMQEDWWLRELIARNLSAIWRRNWFPHNYEVTALEAYMDLYLLTGNRTYLDAVQGAYAMFKEHWIHLGGSMAINEPWAVAYPPSSYYLDYTDTSHNGMSLRYGAPACAGPAGRSAAAAKRWSRRQQQAAGHPTGELCGSVFWIKLNQRFHRIDPTNESYYTEIEREIYNVGVANQEPHGNGIRYFTLLHRNKQDPTNHGTCCEGQGTRLYGSLPEYVFSYNQTALFVNLFAAAQGSFTINGITVVVEVATLFPYDNAVTVTVQPDQPVAFTLFVRVPSWASEPVTMAVSFATDQPLIFTAGSYAAFAPAWSAGQHTISFTLPMVVTAYPYTGLTQIPHFQRFGYLYGPILLAAVGRPEIDTGTIHVSIPGRNPALPDTWLRRSACSKDKLGGVATENHTITLTCGQGTITNVSFASYGTPNGTCDSTFVKGQCDLNSTMATVQRLCQGQRSCTLTATNAFFGRDPCVGVFKRLAVVVSGCTPLYQPTLEFQVTTDDTAALIPYYEVQQELFDVYPVVIA
eukprot:m.147592 g.147592  ORF g.147592 m.147592 type:complete len:838 (+) comp16266_c0_seq1:111-2624(+)